MDMAVPIETGHNLFNNTANGINPEEIHIEGDNPFLRNISLHSFGEGGLAVAPRGIENDIRLVERMRG
jgi:hypothetical protein